MNVFTFTGNIGNDAETRYSQSGAAIANFSVAVTSGYGDHKKTTWVRCALFGKRAEGGLVEYLKKGTQVAVTGELSSSEWKSQDGENKHSIDVRVNEVTLVGGKRDNDNQPKDYAPPKQASQDGAPMNDDIPF